MRRSVAVAIPCVSVMLVLVAGALNAWAGGAFADDVHNRVAPGLRELEALQPFALESFAEHAQRGGQRSIRRLRRELMEELGIEVVVGELIETITHDYPEKTVALKFYRCRWQRHEPEARECLAFAWIRSNQLNDYSFPAADARLLDRLQDSPELWR